MLHSGMYAQTPAIDSLRAAIRTQPADTHQVDRYLLLIDHYEGTQPLYLANNDSIKLLRLSLSQRAFMLAKQLGHNRGFALAARALAILYASMDNRYLSIQYGVRALQSGAGYLSNKEAGSLHALVATGYYKSGFYQKALGYAIQALALTRNDATLQAYPASAALLGNVYDRLGQLDSARRYFNIAYEQFQRRGLTNGVASVWVNEAELEIKEKKYAAALTKLQDALAIIRREGEKGIALDATNNITDVYLALGRVQAAYVNAQYALQLTEEANDVEETLQAHEAMSRVARQMGNYTAAFAHYQAAVALRDTLMTRNASMANIETAVSLAKAEEQLADLAERAEQRRLNLVLVGLIAVALIVITGLIFYIRYSIRQNTQLDNLVKAAQQPALILQYDTGQIMAANRLQAALGTRSLGEIVGKRIADLDPDAAHIYLDWLEQIKSERVAGARPASMLGNKFTRAADGKEFYLTATGFDVRYRGKRAAFFLIQDETDKRLMHQAQTQQKEKMEQTLLALEQTRDRLLAHEKMALLGNLMAGVAHDLNTPLMTVVMLSESGSQFLPAILTLLNTHYAAVRSLITPEIIHALEQYFAQLKPHAAVLNHTQQKTLQQEMIAHLEAEGVAQPARTASKLLLYDITQGWELLIPLFKADAEGTLTQVVFELIQLQVSVQNVQHAGMRTLNIVRSLRSYSHTELHGNTSAINVRESLETILTLFSHDMRKRIALHTDFDDNAFVWANGDRLGQVWANLISNALYAMRERNAREKSGHAQSDTLTVSARLHDETVRVQVMDSGEGIPPTVMHKIFEPLFTTKQKGTGVGLGLSMCRDTIEEFGGSIAAESRPGHTVFTVTLPAHLQTSDAHVTLHQEAAHAPTSETASAVA